MYGRTIPYDIQDFISVIYGKIAFSQYIGKCLSGNAHLICNPALFVAGFINGSIYGFYQTFTVIYYIITLLSIYQMNTGQPQSPEFAVP